MKGNKVINLLVGLALLISSTCLFLLVVEFGLRLIYPKMIWSLEYDWRSRHKDYALDKPKDTFRIVVLGDSFTFGQGVKKEETFTARLESLLNSANKTIRFEVINLGFCGLNTEKELEILERRGVNPDTWLPDERYRGMAYQPDLILLEYTLNDAVAPARKLEQIKEFDDRRNNTVIRVNSGPYSLPLPESMDMFLTKKTMFYPLFINRYQQLLAKMGLREGEFLTAYNENSVRWIHMKYNLANIAWVAKQAGLPAVLVIYPDMIGFDYYPFKNVHERIQRVAEILGFHALDLLPAFKGINAYSLWASPVDAHPNARAHEIAARSIFEYIKKEKLVSF